MRKTILAIFIVVLFSCGKEKSVLLPEIKNAKITEIADVSPIYFFYDETKPDSLELNKNNSIISTNWLVNVDKRLTLKQVIPTISKLQDKKRNAGMHKNVSAGNYYTCNDTSIKNLGFIEFTKVIYVNEEINYNTTAPIYRAQFLEQDKILFTTPEKEIIKTNTNDFFKNRIKDVNLKEEKAILFTDFKSSLTFQDYINYKFLLSNVNFNNLKISPIEFISN